MAFDSHLTTLAVATLGVGWVMAVAGLRKGALELRNRRRVCPACGRRLDAPRCRACDPES